MKLLLATTNPGKIAQIKETLTGIPWPVVTSQELGLGQIDIEETGTTLAENARLKARGVFDIATANGFTDVAVLADDGGLEIDALNGEPGIYARRWAGENATDEQIIAYTLKRLEGIPKEKRAARFSVYQVLILPDGTEKHADGKTEGWIAETVSKNVTPGLPYGALLVVAAFHKRYDDLNAEEHKHTHRAIALNKIRAIIEEYAHLYA